MVKEFWALREKSEAIGASLDITDKAVSVLLQQRCAAGSKRFKMGTASKKMPALFFIAPPLNYHVSTTLPPNQTMVDRRQVKGNKDLAAKVAGLKVKNDTLQVRLDDASAQCAALQETNASLVSENRRLELEVHALRRSSVAQVPPTPIAPSPTSTTDHGGAGIANSYGVGKGQERSWSFKALLRETMSVMPSMSMRQFSRVAALIASAYAKEAGVGAPMSPEAIIATTADIRMSPEPHFSTERTPNLMFCKHFYASPQEVPFLGEATSRIY